MTTILAKDNVSAKIDEHFKALEKAARVLELAKRAHKKQVRKTEEAESYHHFPPLKDRAKRQAEIAIAAHDRLWSHYKRIIKQISHQ